MDYRTFMEQVKEKVDQMSSADKTDFLLNLLRLTPEVKREKILQLMTDDTSSFEQQFQEYQDYLAKLEDKEFHFTAEDEEIYDEFDWEPDYQVILIDSENVGKTLTEILDFAKQLVYQKHYHAACALYIRCLGLQFLTYDKEIGDQYEYYLGELIQEGVVDDDNSSVITHLLYAIYQTTKDTTELVKTFYHYLATPTNQEVKIADIFAVGPESLEQSEEFLFDWINFLKLNPSPLADRLLLDAVRTSSYFKQADHLFTLAQETAATHPYLYLECIHLFSSQNAPEKALEVGKDGLEKIPLHNKVRSQIAEKVVYLAKQFNDDSVFHAATQDTFYSDPCLDNLFPVLKLDLSQQEQEKLLRFVQNDHSVTNQVVLLFFLGQFEAVYKNISSDHHALGWSKSNKGVIIPLLLLLLRPMQYSKAAKALMADINFRISSHQLDVFEDEFIYWKSSVFLPEKNKAQYLNWCKKEIEKRGKELIVTKFRHHYHRMAALIVTLGEAEENNGVMGARAQIIQSYRKKHSRKRNFTAELDKLI
ncbi:hypothetical protein WN873_00675 [Tetragenococcus halophilus]|uniref:hypothetical protein n=1 Tax=Tetragenococcus halophilus TaxID=51669 RepID=UPI0030F2275C